MYHQLVLCVPVSICLPIRLMSTLTKTKNVLNCGVNMAKSKYQAVIHGPTASEVTKDIDLSKKTCLITGANSGIGLEMSRVLSERGCVVLTACRNKYAASLLARNICDQSLLRFYEMNLASFRSVSKCCNKILKDEKKIDIVILNAGVFGLPWTLTEDMLETTFQVNYLSQFLLLTIIDSVIAPDARIVFISSESHRNIKWSIRDQALPSEQLVSLPSHEYTSIKAYNISKLCALLAMHYLGYMWQKSARQVFAVHPGSFVKTRLCRDWWMWELLYTSMLPFTKTISQAASTPLYCATSPDLDGLSAMYFKDLKICDESDMAKDFHLAFRINDLSRELLRERADSLTADEAKTDEAKADRTVCSMSTDKTSVPETLTPEYS